MEIQVRIKSLISILRDFGMVFFIKYVCYKLFRLRKAYNRLIYRRLVHDFREFIDEFNQDDKKKKLQDNIPIWMCWWQGYDNMPELCKICYESIQRSLPDNYVITFITKDNFDKYVEVPDEIQEKMQKGVFGIAHFCDWLRNRLISLYGGFWIDATIYCAKPIDSLFLENENFWSIKLAPEKVNKKCRGQVISQCMYGSFILKGMPNNCVNSFVATCLESYMKKYSVFAEYFTQNFLFRMGYECCNGIRQEILSIPYSNENLYELDKVINEKYEEEKWSRLLMGTSFFKLSWRKEYLKYTEYGERTFYGYLCENYEKVGENRF